ncbi:hypothetical protein [Marivirga sp.]|uniref:hypothetical protein n=1 Tax=Marivirga sp. TaxID=2018662 RepID=UPI0025CE72D1|nr:hypothetical protein [Marivirga sp.]
MKAFIVVTFFICFTMVLKAQEMQPYVFSGGKNFVGKSVFQLEYGVNFERQINDSSRFNQQISQYALIKYGALQGLDILINYNYAREQTFVSDQMRRSNGLANLTVGVKKKLGKNYSLKSNFGLLKDELGKTRGRFQVFGISEHSLNSSLAWENNLGLNWAKVNLQANLMYLSGLTFTTPHPMDFIIEIYGQYGQQTWNNYANIGLGYYFNKDLMLETYIGYGNNLSSILI